MTHLLSRGGLFGSFILPNFEEAWEAKGYPLLGVHYPRRSLVHGGHGQVGALDLPHLHGIEPLVWLHAAVIPVRGECQGRVPGVMADVSCKIDTAPQDIREVLPYLKYLSIYILIKL